MSEWIHKYVAVQKAGFTLLLLHGTGGDENDLLPIGRAIAPHAALLSPRIPEGVGANELRAFIVESSAEANVIALGVSSGANLAAAAMLSYPGTLAGAVLMRPSLSIEPDGEVVSDGKPSVLILAGTQDAIVAPSQTERLAKALVKSGAQVEVRWHNLGHDLGPEDFAAARDYLSQITVVATLRRD